MELLKASSDLENVQHQAKSEWFFKESYSSISDLSDSDNDEIKEISKLKNERELFRCSCEKDKLIVTVIDTGVGIKRKDQQNLFKLFGCL